MQKNLCPNNLLVQNNLVQKSLGPKKFGVQKKFGLKNFDLKLSLFRNIGPKKIGHTNFGSKIILGQSLVKISVVLAEIFHHAQTRTNVAGTNLAWSNVPKTHKKLFLSRNLDLDSEMSGQYIWTQRAVRFCRLRGNRLLFELRT